MPIPTGEQTVQRGGCGTPRPGAGGALSLPVLAAHPGGHGDTRHIAKSKVGPLRAAVLIGVNLLMAGHITLWVTSGMRETLSPVEPSESMHTLEQGVINAGFIFFTLAILSTFVLGRWFCGWGCHVVALQDLCGWAMKKVGVKPKPFRSRLLVMVPILLALYMFAWPTTKREVIKPLAGERWAALAPYLGEVGPRPQLHLGLTKKNFWETFPPWYVGIPFLALCGFGTVYFLGAKGYCTYGCPYGGFFGPADRVAPGRILVTDACEGCGHCTAVCTSNVRVHEEVRDHGMVVDPGCMKCMDCVSVCPKDALYFGFAKPPGKTAPSRRRLYDVSLAAELVLFAVGLLLFWCYRGMGEGVPMLMATAIAAIGAFLCWKVWQLLFEPNSRIQNLQLKIKGRVRPLGLLVGAATVLLLTGAAWGFAVQYNLNVHEIALSRVTPTMEQMLARDYQAPPDQRALASQALAHLRRTGPPADGGFGWNASVKAAAARAYLNMVVGDLAETEKWLVRTFDLDLHRNAHPASQQVLALVKVMARRGAPLPEVVAKYRDLVSRAPESAEARLTLGQLLASSGDRSGSVEQAEAALANDPNNIQIAYAIGQFMGTLEEYRVSLRAFERVVTLEPASGPGWAGIGLNKALLGDGPGAAAAFAKALEREPNNPLYMQYLASVLRDLGRGEEASELERRANGLSAGSSPPGPGR